MNAALKTEPVRKDAPTRWKPNRLLSLPTSSGGWTPTGAPPTTWRSGRSQTVRSTIPDLARGDRHP
jgi:hypothetical protein